MAEIHSKSLDLHCSSEWEATSLQRHFLTRLRSAESQLKHVISVQSLTSSPTAAEFEQRCRTFHAQPLVMPADWVPQWTGILQSTSVIEGLETLIGAEVEVEVFRLDFQDRSGDFGSVVSPKCKRGSYDLDTEEAGNAPAGSSKKQRRVEDVAVFSISGVVKEACETSTPSAAATLAADTNATRVVTRRAPEEASSSASPPELQPASESSFSYLPNSSVHSMPLGQFLSICRQPATPPSGVRDPYLPASQLMYLTWRGLPQSSASMESGVELSSSDTCQEKARKGGRPDSKVEAGSPSLDLGLEVRVSRGSNPLGFKVFIDQLLVPTLSPPFLTALRQENALDRSTQDEGDKSKISSSATVHRTWTSGGREQWNLWVGRSATSQIHFDGMDNVHVCLQGSKLFHLYKPADAIFLYPNQWKEDSLNNKSSLPSILTASPEDHPRFFSHATCHRVQLMQGEAIFIPAGWWHEVFTFGPVTISANVWFPSHSSCRLRPTLMMLHSHRILHHMRAASEKELAQDSNQELASAETLGQL